MSATVARRKETVKLPPRPAGRRRGAAGLERGALIGTTALPLPLIFYVAVNSGGYSRGITAVAAVLMAALLALRCLLAPRTVRRPGTIALVGAGALFALGAWQLLSAGWSHSTVRAVQEFDRTALYLLVWLTFVTLPRRQLRPLTLWVGAAILVVAGMGLATRLRPDVFTITQNAAPERLAFPITYWNAMGILIAFGLILCVHYASAVTGPKVLRVAGAALAPALATTLYLTLSRGGLGGAVAGVLVYAVLARPRGLVLGLLAIVPASYLAVHAAYDATALISHTPTSAKAVAQGRDLLGTVFVGCLFAAAVRAILTPLDSRLRAVRLPSPSRDQRRLAWGGAALAVVVLAFAAGGPSKAQDYYQRFVNDSPAKESTDARSRLGEVYNAGRISHWKVALHASRGERLHGVGAGMFDELWYRDRPNETQVTEAHNLYVETLAELGIVGLALLLTFIGAMVAAAISRRHRRAAAAAIGAVIAAWALHVALDWDWEVPAVTLIPIILAAAAAAVPATPSNGRRRFTPLIAGLAAVALAILPALAALAETNIDEAQNAYRDNDCPTAINFAQRARSLQSSRPEPHAILALCALRDDARADALRSSRRAVSVDPGDWEWRYLDALIVGTTGGDPRPELAAARARNPRGTAPRAFQQVLRETPRALWPLRSVQAYVWMNGRAYHAIRP